VSVVTSKATDLLPEAVLDRVHEIPVTAVPQLVPTGERSAHPVARGFENVVTYDFGIPWGQLPMPVNTRRTIGHAQVIGNVRASPNQLARGVSGDNTRPDRGLFRGTVKNFGRAGRWETPSR